MRTWAGGGVAVLLLLAVGGGVLAATRPASSSQAPTAAPTPSASLPDGAPTSASALEVLATLPVKGKAPLTGYERAARFGTAWLDVDHNGCDTRDDILRRDLTDVVQQGACRVLSGTLDDKYTGASVDFVRGEKTSALVQIDHIVPLANAWITGAQQLTQAQRVSLANDPLNLIAVDGRSNEQKSAGDAATWLPSNTAFRCEYVARQISVKAAYGLWVTRAEHDAMTRILSGCTGQPAESAPFTPPSPAPTPAPAPAAGYATCAQARAAGAAPLHAGRPGYSHTLDRDDDGVACEN